MKQETKYMFQKCKSCPYAFNTDYCLNCEEYKKRTKDNSSLEKGMEHFDSCFSDMEEITDTNKALKESINIALCDQKQNHEKAMLSVAAETRKRVSHEIREMIFKKYQQQYDTDREIYFSKGVVAFLKILEKEFDELLEGVDHEKAMLSVVAETRKRVSHDLEKEVKK